MTNKNSFKKYTVFAKETGEIIPIIYETKAVKENFNKMEKLDYEIKTFSTKIKCNEFMEECSAKNEKNKDANEKFLQRPLSQKEEEFIKNNFQNISTNDNKTLRNMIAEKKEELYNKTPLSEKQIAVINQHGSDKIKEAIQNKEYGKCRDFLQEQSFEKEKEMREKPLSKAQTAIINIYASAEVNKEINNGNFLNARKFIDHLYTKMNDNVDKYMEKNSSMKLTEEDRERLFKAERIIQRFPEMGTMRENIYKETIHGLDSKEIGEFVKTQGKEQNNKSINKPQNDMQP